MTYATDERRLMDAAQLITRIASLLNIQAAIKRISPEAQKAVCDALELAYDLMRFDTPLAEALGSQPRPLLPALCAEADKS